MNIFLAILGGLILFISLFTTWMSWGFYKRNQRIARLGNGDDKDLDPQSFGRPKLFIQLGIIGMIVGAILLFTNI